MLDSEALTVIVVPLLGGDALTACLDSLPLHAVECIVILRPDTAAAAGQACRYPTVRFVAAADVAVPRRRRDGATLATGGLVALLEDTSLPDPGWCAAVRAAFDDPAVAAASGPVRISGTLPTRLQALGWSEYGAFAPRPQAGAGASATPPPPRLPGNNIAFRRAMLLEALGEGEEGLVEGPICRRLQAGGLQLAYHHGMTVTYAGADWYGAALGTRLQHGRLYAAGQAAGRGLPHRLALAAKAGLLPVALSLRALGAMWGAVPVAALPRLALWIALMESAWAAGEAIGSLAGAGRSLEAWR